MQVIGFLSPKAWRNQIRGWSDGRFKTIDKFLVRAERASRSLELIQARMPMRQDEIVLVSAVCNEAVRLRAFLEHYRTLGVDRFVFIDNESSDDTQAILLEAPDADVWLARDDYKTGCLLWLSAFIHAFARDKWAVVADADEFLVYDGMERHDLHALSRRLEESGEHRLRAYMIDLYGEGPIRATPWPAGNPLKAQWYFDQASYVPGNGSLAGGPRTRVLSTTGRPFRNNIGKYPLTRFDAASGLTNIHHPYPYHFNSGPPIAALLHLKFTSDFGEVVDQAIEKMQHWRGASEYRVYQDALRRDPDLTLHYGCSLPYIGPASLIEAGLMEPIDWDRPMPIRNAAVSPPRHRVHSQLRAVLGPHFSRIRERHQRVFK